MSDIDEKLFNALAGASLLITKMIGKFGILSEVRVSGEETPPAVYVEWLHLGLNVKMIAKDGQTRMALWNPPGEITDPAYLKRRMEAQKIIGEITGDKEVEED